MTPPMSPTALNYAFTAPMEVDNAFPFFLTVPGSVELLGTRRAAKVEGTLDGIPFAATLMPSGSGPHWLPLRAALRTAINKHRAGDEVAVHLTLRLS